MKQLSSTELDDGLPLLAEGPALDEAFDGCIIVSRDIAWLSPGFRLALVEMSCMVDFLLS